jgi:hypothetical protein
MKASTVLSRAAVAALAALWTLPATSALQNIENAYEIEAGNILMPSGNSGQAIVQPCATCKSVLLGVTPETTYQVGLGTPSIPLSKFRAALQKDGHQLLVVTYRIDSRAVTRMVLAK